MSLVTKTELCGLIPHAGDMCLLDEVIAWDEEHIVCRSRSHLQQTNPLRSQQGLSSIVLLEYGAQAMAVHGGLMARQQGCRINEGYLAALRDIKIKDTLLENIECPLTIEADKLMSQDSNMIYQFSVKADEVILATGRATVIAKL